MEVEIFKLVQLSSRDRRLHFNIFFCKSGFSHKWLDIAKSCEHASRRLLYQSLRHRYGLSLLPSSHETLEGPWARQLPPNAPTNAPRFDHQCQTSAAISAKYQLRNLRKLVHWRSTLRAYPLPEGHPHRKKKLLQLSILAFRQNLAPHLYCLRHQYRRLQREILAKLEGRMCGHSRAVGARQCTATHRHGALLTALRCFH